MIKINPHSHHSHSTTTTLKTAEILSKYRPIAPKPGTQQANEDDPSSPSMSHKINQSPYLRNLWPQLQARPTRTRKRGRGGMMGPPTSNLSLKRPKSISQRVFSGSFQALTTHAPALVTLPLLPSSKCMEPETKGKGVNVNVIDLNKTTTSAQVMIQEIDFLKQLQGPRVIAPQPVRPLCSRINVASCFTNTSVVPSQIISKKSPQELEEEVECDDLPAVISDSNNRVRLVNSAYKEMMGQPECSWLDSIVRGKRICGDVIIHFSPSNIPPDNGFSCWVKIEWGRDGKEESVHAFCDVIRLSCDSKDYLFTWRFHTTTDSCKVTYHSTSNA